MNKSLNLLSIFDLKNLFLFKRKKLINTKIYDINTNKNKNILRKKNQNEKGLSKENLLSLNESFTYSTSSFSSNEIMSSVSDIESSSSSVNQNFIENNDMASEKETITSLSGEKLLPNSKKSSIFVIPRTQKTYSQELDIERTYSMPTTFIKPQNTKEDVKTKLYEFYRNNNEISYDCDAEDEEEEEFENEEFNDIGNDYFCNLENQNKEELIRTEKSIGVREDDEEQEELNQMNDKGTPQPTNLFYDEIQFYKLKKKKKNRKNLSIPLTLWKKLQVYDPDTRKKLYENIRLCKKYPELWEYSNNLNKKMRKRKKKKSDMNYKMWKKNRENNEKRINESDDHYYNTYHHKLSSNINFIKCKKSFTQKIISILLESIKIIFILHFFGILLLTLIYYLSKKI